MTGNGEEKQRRGKAEDSLLQHGERFKKKSKPYKKKGNIKMPPNKTSQHSREIVPSD